MSDHAKLSPSSSKRWLNCTPSVRLSEQFPDTAGAAADEGTLAHTVAELFLAAELTNLSPDEFNRALAEAQERDYYSTEMERHASDYAQLVAADYRRMADTRPVELNIEGRVDLEKYVPGGFGRTDASLIAPPVLRIYDYKYGRVPVAAENNPQTMLYALGELERVAWLHDIEFVELVIFQPRIGNTSRFSYSAEHLRTWGDTFVKPRAEMADAGTGVLSAGKWCTYCPARFECAERARAAHAEAAAMFGAADPELFTLDQMARIVKQTEIFEPWLKDARSAISKALLEGEKVRGFKMVLGKGRRSWADEAGAIKKLRSLKFKQGDYVNKKVKGIGDVTDLLGVDAFNEHMAEFINRGEGKPELADANDDRPEYGLASVQAAFAAAPKK